MGDWTRGIIAGLDTEATGTDPLYSRMIAAAVCETQDGELLPDALSLLVRPAAMTETEVTLQIPEEASLLHGITPHRLDRDGVDTMTALLQVRERLDELTERRVPVACFNAAYHWTLICAEFDLFGWEGPQRPWFIDPMVLDRWAQPSHHLSRRLGHVTYRHGVHYDERAPKWEADALAAAQLAFQMGRSLYVADHEEHPMQPDLLGMADLAFLQRFQAMLHESHASDLRRYYEGRGSFRLASRVMSGWPLSVPSYPDTTNDIG
jgi:DNA polymerase III epsilon subunit-like protein